MEFMTTQRIRVPTIHQCCCSSYMYMVYLTFEKKKNCALLKWFWGATWTYIEIEQITPVIYNKCLHNVVSFIILTIRAWIAIKHFLTLSWRWHFSIGISLKLEQYCPLKIFIRLSIGRWGMWVSIKCVIHMYGKSHDYS